jgi:cell division protein FtsQ
MVMERKKVKRMSQSAKFYVPGAILLIFFVILLGTSVFLSIIEINVSGASKYKENEIIKASGISPGANMLFLDKNGVKQKIISAMPYISEVLIKFDLPDKVEISISETEALAAIGSNGGFLLVDAKCKIVEKVERLPKGMIEVKGFKSAVEAVGGKLTATQGDDTRLRYVEEILAAFDTAGIQDGVSYLDVTNMGNVCFGYMDKFTVVLSGSSGVAAKLSKLPEAIVDVRKDAGFDATARYRIDIPDSSGSWIWTPEW